MDTLTLVSHHLCPYAQRAAIALSEKGLPFERIDIDLADKPDWFKAISPLGKVPLLKVSHSDGTDIIFESGVILEYLEDSRPNPLHPTGSLQRARHRSWIEFGSTILNRIARFYNAPTASDLKVETEALTRMFESLENELSEGPWFAGYRFSLVDAVYGPIFRYFDVFETIGDYSIFDHTPKITVWRQALSERPSVRNAVITDYPMRLLQFLLNRNSALSAQIAV